MSISSAASNPTIPDHLPLSCKVPHCLSAGGFRVKVKFSTSYKIFINIFWATLAKFMLFSKIVLHKSLTNSIDK